MGKMKADWLGQGGQWTSLVLGWEHLFARALLLCLLVIVGGGLKQGY
jgi:hypothetical protein